jgi:uncharacterized protein (DUF736 family)
MATIGTFNKDKAGNYNGAIKTLTLNVKQAVLLKTPKDNVKSPDFRIFSGQTEFGAAWMKTSREERSYLSVKLDDGLTHLRGHQPSVVKVAFVVDHSRGTEPRRTQ